MLMSSAIFRNTHLWKSLTSMKLRGIFTCICGYMQFWRGGMEVKRDHRFIRFSKGLQIKEFLP